MERVELIAFDSMKAYVKESLGRSLWEELLEENLPHTCLGNNMHGRPMSDGAFLRSTRIQS